MKYIGFALILSLLASCLIGYCVYVYIRDDGLSEEYANYKSDIQELAQDHDAQYHALSMHWYHTAQETTLTEAETLGTVGGVVSLGALLIVSLVIFVATDKTSQPSS